MSSEESVFDELENSSTEPSIGQDFEDWWVPDNDQLMGVVVEMHSAPEQYTEEGEVPDPIYTIVSIGRGDFDEGEARCTKTHVQILSGLDGAGLGDLVNLTHKGLQRTDNGNAANTYEVGVIDAETWEQSDQADSIQEVVDGYNGATGDNRDTEPYTPSGGSSSASSAGSPSEGGDKSEAEEFFEDIIDMQNGSMSVDQAETMLLDARGFDVDVEMLATDLGWDVEGGEITAWE